MRSSTLVVCALLGMTSTACLAQTASPDPSTGAHAWTPRSMKASNIVPADTGQGSRPCCRPRRQGMTRRRATIYGQPAARLPPDRNG